MGRKPDPTAIKIAKGVRKSRINTLEPDLAPDNSPEPPEHLDGYAASEWRRLYPELTAKGVLKAADRMVLAGYCEAYSEYRKASAELAKCKRQICTTPNGAVQAVPFVSMKRNWLLVMLKYSTELGITPSSRSKISGVPKAAPGGGIKDFLQRGFTNGKTSAE